MGIDRAALLSGGLYLNSHLTGLYAVVGVMPLYDQVRVPIVVGIAAKGPGVRCHTGREHIGQEPGHIRRSEGIVKPGQPPALHKAVHVVKEIVNVLHRQAKILDPEVEWQV